MKKTPWFTALLLSCALVLTPTLSDAKRLGGGKSSGMQRSMPERTAPDAPPARPAQPAQQAAPTNAPAQAAAPAAAPAKRSWLGPIAGIAAGLGLAALMSHLGLSEAFGSFLLLALLAVAGFFLVRWLMRRMQPQPAGMARSAMNRAPTQVAWPPAETAPSPAAHQAATPADVPPMAAVAGARPPAAFVPASFDSEGFARIAKTIFVRLQAANDAGDLNELRRFTTPEMFAELKTDLLEREGKAGHTDVLDVAATVLDVAEEDGRQVVSVRYTGRVSEDGGAPLEFDEVWHLVKPEGDDARGWSIAGIEQLTRA